MFQTALERGVIRYTDSPLLRAVALGRVLVVDEADKAPEHVVAIFRSLAGQGELTLSDGRRLARVVEREGDLPIHPRFRLILLANRPGYRRWLSLWAERPLISFSSLPWEPFHAGFGGQLQLVGQGLVWRKRPET